MMKKSLMIVIVFLLIVSVFSIAQSGQEELTEAVEETSEDCNLGCKVWQFLFGNPANRAGKGWFDRTDALVGQAPGGYSSCSSVKTNDYCWHDGYFYKYVGKTGALNDYTWKAARLNSETGKPEAFGEEWVTAVALPDLKIGAANPQTVSDFNKAKNSYNQKYGSTPAKEQEKFDQAPTGKFAEIPGGLSGWKYQKIGGVLYAIDENNGLQIYKDGQWKKPTPAEQATLQKESKAYAVAHPEGPPEQKVVDVTGLPEDYEAGEKTTGTWKCDGDLCICDSNTCTNLQGTKANRGDSWNRFMIASKKEPVAGETKTLPGDVPTTMEDAIAQGWKCDNQGNCDSPDGELGFSYAPPESAGTGTTSGSITEDQSFDYTYGDGWQCQTGGGCLCSNPDGCTDKYGVLVDDQTFYASEYILLEGTSESDYTSSSSGTSSGGGSNQEAQQVTGQKIPVPKNAVSGQNLFGSSAACSDCKYWKGEDGTYYKVGKDGTVYVLNDEQKEQLASKGDALPVIKTSKPVSSEAQKIVDAVTKDAITLSNKALAATFLPEKTLKKYDKQIQWDKVGLKKDGSLVLPLEDKKSSIAVTLPDKQGMQLVNFDIKDGEGKVNPAKSKEQILSNKQTVAEQTEAQKETGVIRFIGTGNDGLGLQTVNAIDKDAWQDLKDGKEIEYFGTSTTTEGGFLGFGKNAKEVTSVTKQVAGKVELKNGVAQNTNYLEERQVKVDTKTGEMFDNDGDYDEKKKTFTPTTGFYTEPSGRKLIAEYETSDGKTGSSTAPTLDYSGLSPDAVDTSKADFDPEITSVQFYDPSTGFQAGMAEYDSEGNVNWKITSNPKGTFTVTNAKGESKDFAEEDVQAIAAYTGANENVMKEAVSNSQPSGFTNVMSSIYVVSDQLKNYPALNNLMWGDQDWYKDWKGWADRTFAPMLGTNWFSSWICDNTENRRDMEPEGKAVIKTVSGTYQAVASVQMERSDRKTPLLCYINPNPEGTEEFVCDSGQVCIENFCYKDIDRNGEADDETVLEGYFYKISWGVSAPRDEAFTPYVDENGIAVSFNIWIDNNANDKVDAGAKYMYSETGNVAGPIELKNSAMDQDVIIKYSDKLYEEVCIKWDKAPVTTDNPNFGEVITVGLTRTFTDTTSKIPTVCFEAQEIEVGSVKYEGSDTESKSTSVSSGDVNKNSQW